MNKDTEKNADISDLELNHKLSNLDWDIQPDRDLWGDISTKIRFADKARKKTFTWMPVAMAASVLLATGALVFSTMTYQRLQDAEQYQASLVSYQNSHIALVDQQHQMVRAQLLNYVGSDSTAADPLLISELETLMANIDLAAAEIKKALILQPNNLNYTSMLVRTYQHEVNFLNTIQSSQTKPIKAAMTDYKLI